jgi:hypothetical protein
MTVKPAPSSEVAAVTYELLAVDVTTQVYALASYGQFTSDSQFSIAGQVSPLTTASRIAGRAAQATTDATKPPSTRPASWWRRSLCASSPPAAGTCDRGPVPGQPGPERARDRSRTTRPDYLRRFVTGIPKRQRRCVVRQGRFALPSPVLLAFGLGVADCASAQASSKTAVSSSAATSQLADGQSGTTL